MLLYYKYLLQGIAEEQIPVLANAFDKDKNQLSPLKKAFLERCLVTLQRYEHLYSELTTNSEELQYDGTGREEILDVIASQLDLLLLDQEGRPRTLFVSKVGNEIVFSFQRQDSSSRVSGTPSSPSSQPQPSSPFIALLAGQDPETGEPQMREKSRLGRIWEGTKKVARYTAYGVGVASTALCGMGVYMITHYPETLLGLLGVDNPLARRVAELEGEVEQHTQNLAACHLNKLGG